MELNEAIIHARQVAEGCGVDSRDCAYQHDKLVDWLEELQAYRASGLTPDELPRAAELVRVEKLVGQTIYQTMLFFSRLKEPEALIVEGLSIWHGEITLLCKNGVKVNVKKIGETVFLTRTEAEAALGGDGNG